jgi:hypothetical protein
MYYMHHTNVCLSTYAELNFGNVRHVLLYEATV